MAERGKIEVNRFTKGLITEANPLTYPAEASLDEINFKLKKNGSRERRLGLDYEDNYALYDTGLSSDVLASARVRAYRWSMPSGHFDVEIGVIQVGNTLYFIDLLTDNPSANLLNGGVGISAVGTSNDQIMTFATINNYLVGISNVIDDPYLFSYNKDTDTVSYETAPIMVRDMWGVDDGLGVNERPATLSDAHKYNLLNQGWDENIVSTCGAGISAIDCTFNTLGVYPSNSDPWTIGRVEDLTDANAYKFDPTQAANNIIAIGQIARGHYVIPLFNRSSGRVSLTSLNLPMDSELGRFTAIASYAGRVFYAGISHQLAGGDSHSPQTSGMVFFSQLFATKENLVRCYQETDPTNPDFNDMLDTDGGVIVIPECAYIWQLKPIKQSLFVFGVNGVWEIRGDEGGFRATSYQVNKVSNVGVYARNSIEEVNGAIYFWGTGGIYQIAPNQFGTFDTNNLTLETIQRLYNSIPDSSKRNSRVYYDQHTNTLRWLYYSSETKEIGNPIDYLPPAAPTVPTVSIGGATTLSGVQYFDIIGYSSTRLLTTHYKNSNLILSLICDISGTNFSTTTESTFVTEASIPTTSAGSDIAVMRLGSTLVNIHSTNEASRRIGVSAATLSGTVYTPGLISYPYTSNGATGITLRLIKLTDTRAFCVFFDSARPSTTGLRAFTIDVTGTTVTTGTVLTITQTTSVNYNIHRIDDNTVLLIREDATLGRTSKLLTISGTTISESSNYSITGWADAPTSINVHMVNGASGYIHYIGNSKSRVRYFTRSGNAVTVSSYLELSSNTLGGGSNSVDSILIDNEYLLNTYQLTSTNVPYINLSRVYNNTGANTTVTPLQDITISSTAALTDSENIRLSHVEGTTYVVGYRSSGNVLNLKLYNVG